METWSENGDNDDVIPAPTPPPQLSSLSKKASLNKNLIQKLETIISSYELQEKYSTRLTEHSMEVIEKIIKTKPEFMRIVESTLIRNINNTKLDANDVPYIISIISQLYNLLSQLNVKNNAYNEPPSDTCASILKFIFSVAIRENLIKVDNEKDGALLLLCCDNIVDACIKLLKLPTSQQVPKVIDEIKLPTNTTIIIPAKKQGWCC